MHYTQIIPNCIDNLQKEFNVIIECLENTNGHCWNFIVSPAQSEDILEKLNDKLDDALDEYEDAIASFYTFDGHYFANVINK